MHRIRADLSFCVTLTGAFTQRTHLDSLDTTRWGDAYRTGGAGVRPKTANEERNQSAVMGTDGVRCRTSPLATSYEGHKDGAVDRREAWGATWVAVPGLGPRRAAV